LLLTPQVYAPNATRAAERALRAALLTARGWIV